MIINLAGSEKPTLLKMLIFLKFSRFSIVFDTDDIQKLVLDNS